MKLNSLYVNEIWMLVFTHISIIREFVKCSCYLSVLHWYCWRLRDLSSVNQWNSWRVRMNLIVCILNPGQSILIFFCTIISEHCFHNVFSFSIGSQKSLVGNSVISETLEKVFVFVNKLLSVTDSLSLDNPKILQSWIFSV